MRLLPLALALALFSFSLFTLIFALSPKQIQFKLTKLLSTDRTFSLDQITATPTLEITYTAKLKSVDLSHSFTFSDINENQPKPDWQDKATILSFANICKDSYDSQLLPNSTTVPSQNATDGFGWNGDGVRGYIYENPDQNIIIMSIKGTSTSFFGIGDGETAPRDKYNDNLMFSCCCARVDFSWTPVCGCVSGGKVCNATCLAESAIGEDTYIQEAIAIYEKLRLMYPSAAIWLTGHSLGGALASLLATMFKDINMAVTFCAPGEQLYAWRLGLYPQSIEGVVSDLERIVHFGQTSDPIYAGRCNGVRSSCYVTGYAMETKCHNGLMCPYLTGTSLNIRRHRITDMIDVIKEQELIPLCSPQINCTDCDEWDFEV